MTICEEIRELLSVPGYSYNTAAVAHSAPTIAWKINRPEPSVRRTLNEMKKRGEVRIAKAAHSLWLQEWALR